MNIEEWFYYITLALSLVTAILAWVAKIRWSKEYRNTQEAILQAKDTALEVAQKEVEVLERNVELWRDRSPRIYREHMDALQEQLTEYTEDLEREFSNLTERAAEYEEQIQGLKQEIRDDEERIRELEEVASTIEHERRVFEADYIIQSLGHSIMSSLQGIWTPLDWINATIQEDEENGKKVKVLREAIHNLLRVEIQVSNLIVSNWSDGYVGATMAKVDLKALVRNTISSFENTAKYKAIEIRSILPGCDVNVDADARIVNTILYNLIENSLSYHNPHLSKGVVEICVEPGEEMIRVSVQDNGIGIPEGEEDQIFGLYVRGSNVMPVKPSGVGLGLTASKRLVQEIGGSIILEKRVNPTTFILSLLPYRGKA